MVPHTFQRRSVCEAQGAGLTTSSAGAATCAAGLMYAMHATALKAARPATAAMSCIPERRANPPGGEGSGAIMVTAADSPRVTKMIFP